MVYDLDRILLPLEGFPAEIEALNVALYLAECSGAILVLYHSRRGNKDTEGNFERHRLRASEKSEFMGTRLEVQIDESDPVTGIVERGEEHDLIVMGGRRKLREKIFGSVSSSVIRQIPNPSLVVTAPISTFDHQERPLRRLLVPLEDVEEDLAAIKLAASLTSSATIQDFELTALHVVTLPLATPITAEAEDSERERSFLKEVGMMAQHVGRPIVPRVVVGRSVGRSVVSFAEEDGSDIILLGDRRKPGPFTRLIGTHALYISRNAPCPVVLIYRP